MSIQRYDCLGCEGTPSGDWVKYTDHARIVERLGERIKGFDEGWARSNDRIAALEAEIARLREACSNAEMWFSEEDLGTSGRSVLAGLRAALAGGDA